MIATAEQSAFTPVASPAATPTSVDAAAPAGVGDVGAPGSALPAGVTVADFDRIAPVACPCGQARRAFADVADFPGTLHRTEISVDARRHHHKRLTETYTILECGPGAALELDDHRLPVHPGMSVIIRPGVRHRAVGRMTVLILAIPKFDPHDEWFD